MSTISRLFLGAAALTLLIGIESERLPTVLDTLTSSSFLTPLLILYLVICLEAFIRTLHLVDGLAYSMTAHRSRRASLALIPALVGILPTIGGARFSLSLLEELVSNREVDPLNLSAINYWYRHVHMFSNPLITGTILACSIAGVSLNEVILYLTPMTIACFGFGWYFLIRPVSLVEGASAKQSGAMQIWALPVMMSIITAGILMDWPLYATLSVSLLLCVFLQLKARGSAMLWSWFTPKINDRKLLLDVFSILLFVHLLQQTGLTATVGNWLMSSGIDPLTGLLVATFVLGLLTGISQAYVALVMPVVATIFPNDLPIVCLVLWVGMVSQLITPAHLCLVVSAKSCGNSVFPVLKRIALPLLASIASYLLFIVLHG